MSLKFEFVPHNINNMYQDFRKNHSFSRHLLINTNNINMWEIFLSIDPYSLCINKNSSIEKVIYIITYLKHLVSIYMNSNQLKDYEYKEVMNYDFFLEYLNGRLKYGDKKNTI